MFEMKMSFNIGSKTARLLFFSMPLLALFAGCGKGQLEALQSELADEQSTNERLQKQIEEQKEEAQSANAAQLSKIEELKSSLAKMKEREKTMYTQYLAKLSSKNKEVKKFKSAYLALKAQDQTEFARLGNLLNEKKWDEGSNGLKTFIITYPNSEFLEDARKEYSRAQSESRKQATEEAATIQRSEDAQRKEKLNSQIKNGELSPEQIKPYIIGKTPQQVRGLLGEPSSTYTGNKWRYTDQVFNPYSGVKNSLKIQFKNGVVTVVDYWGEN